MRDTSKLRDFLAPKSIFQSVFKLIVEYLWFWFLFVVIHAIGYVSSLYRVINRELYYSVVHFLKWHPINIARFVRSKDGSVGSVGSVGSGDLEIGVVLYGSVDTEAARKKVDELSFSPGGEILLTAPRGSKSGITPKGWRRAGVVRSGKERAADFIEIDGTSVELLAAQHKIDRLSAEVERLQSR